MIYTDLVIYKLGATGFLSQDTKALGAAKTATLTRFGRNYKLSIEKVKWATPNGQARKRGLFASKKKTNAVPISMKMLDTYHVLANSPTGSVFLKVQMIAANPLKAEFDIVETNPSFGAQQQVAEQRIRRATTVVGAYFRDSVASISDGDIDSLCADLVGGM